MRRTDESGFALLLVFLMASVVAIGLYYELPRVAMETQRQKEQLLIERGEQYKRAIQLFYKKAGRYPGDLKELESFQNQRFLRHRYVDPLTGKEEWRLIHMQNGVLTDSLVTKPKAPGQGDQKDGSTLGQYIGVQAGMGDTQNGPQGGALNARDRRRASDGGNGPTGPDGQPVAAQNGGAPAAPGQGIPGQSMPGQSIPGQSIPGQGIPGQPNPGQAQLPAGQIYPSGPYPGGLPNGPGNPDPNAQPNPAELKKMDGFAATKETSSSFAQRAKLKATSVEYPAP